MRRVGMAIGEIDQVRRDQPAHRGSSRLRRSVRLDEFAIRAAMHEEIHRELYRSRRYGRSFALLRIAPPTDRGIDEQAPRLAAFLRLIDRAWTTDHETWLLLPETGTDEALSLLDRIRVDAPRLFAGRSVGLAIFPETALTLAGLLAAALAGPERSGRVDAGVSRVNVSARQDDAVQRSS